MTAKKEIRGMHRYKYEVLCSGLFLPLDCSRKNPLLSTTRKRSHRSL